MKKTICICAFLFSAFSGFTQVVDTSAVVREADSLVNQARHFMDDGDIDEAQRVAQICAGLLEQHNFPENANYNKSLYDLGLVFKSLGSYEKAISLLNRSLVLFEKTLGYNNKTYIANLINLSDLYIRNAQYDDAEKLLTQAQTLWLSRGETHHQYYAHILNTLGRLYEETNRLNEVEALYLEAKNIRADVLGVEHTDYVRILYSLGTFYQKMGRYQEAEKNLLEARTIWLKKFGNKQANYANIINGLANVYWELGEYNKAEPLLLEATNLWRETQGSDHPNYASGLDNLGMLYLSMGIYEKVEPLFLEAKNIRYRALGPEHPDFATSLDHLSSYYQDIGSLEKAATYLKEELEIQRQTLENTHPDYTATLSNLGNIYADLNNIAEAERLISEAKSIYEKTLGRTHPNYASACTNLARIKIASKQYPLAESYLLEAKSIFEQSLGTTHPRYANCLQSLAILSERSGNFEQAEKYYQSTQDIRKKVLGEAHKDQISATLDLAVFYQKRKKSAAASAQFQTALALLSQEKKGIVRYCSELEAILFQKQYEPYLYYFFSHLNDNSFNFRLSEAGFDYILQSKNYLLENRIKIQNTVSLTDSFTIESYNTWLGLQRRLASIYASPISERKTTTDLEEQANTLEKDLARTIFSFGDATRQVTWQEVQSALRPNEAALEFIHFTYHAPEPTDSVLYAALLLKPGMQHPMFIPLCEEKQLKALLPTADKKINNDQVNELYGNDALYRLLWSPLESQLADTRTVYYSPDGLLHRLNLAALPTGPKAVLSDRHDMVALGSTRQLVTEGRRVSANETPTALIYGGIQFDMDSTLYPVQQAGSTDGSRGLSFAQTDSTLRGDAWDFLKWSEKEVDNISAALSRSGVSAIALKGWLATEESFKQLGQPGASPRILHLSTHGFFFPDPSSNPKSQIPNMSSEEPVFKLSDHPMIRSGLILAGANYAWKTGRPLGNREDGILTAYEISQTDLRNTELVVLSACETGLGHIEGNEGVYGLQRAFKIAGAKTLVMSLWQVPDYQTQELMTVFYGKLLAEKLPARLALRAAQDEMRRQHYEPYYWAGFVVVE